MDKYYHFTTFNNLNNIITEGLIPQTGFRCKSIADDNCGVFLSKGIDKTIIMFALMFSYYNKYFGIEGDKVIAEEMNTISELEKYRNNAFFNQSVEDNIKKCESVIQRVRQVQSCSDFISYLGGIGCLLSINGLSGISDTVPENCCYHGIIPPNNINIVYLGNKYRYEIVNVLYPVLSYCMYLYPIEEVIKNDKYDSKDSLYQLYKDRDSSCCTIYNLENYNMYEMPISYLNQNIQRVKTLT